MVTHQNDWQRMAFMSWALGYYKPYAFIETGVCEGETIGYFGQFATFAGGCDIKPDVIEIAKKRYPHIGFTVQDAREYLKSINPIYRDTFFYLDCTWGDYLPAKEQLPIIFDRWKFDRAIVFVSGVQLPNNSSGAQPLSDLTPYGTVIYPRYSMYPDQSGYALIVPKRNIYHLPNSWGIVNVD